MKIGAFFVFIQFLFQSKNYGFADGTNTDNDYSRDVNGSMIRDRNKGITAISYNHLNLLAKVTTSQGIIEYFYRADGSKLKKIVSTGATRDYSGNYIYENGDLQFFSHPEGYVNAEGSGYKYVYQYKDHLGNIRLSYQDADNNGSIAANEIVEESNYYPFGGLHKGYNNIVNGTYHPYDYQGKENQEELGLNWHDFGARNYDASLGRWMNIDPLAEKYQDITPYGFVGNNPIIFIDPDGKQIAPGSQKEFDRQKQNVIAQRDKLQGKINGLNAKATEKGWSAKKLASRIGNMQDRVNGLNDAVSNLGVLESSKQVYSLDFGAAQNGVKLNTSTNEIVISYSGTALFTHETTHAGQFETGDIAFDSSTGNTLAQDVYDEVAGYKAQWAYDPSSVGGLNSQSQITPSWVQGVTDPATGNQPYTQGGTANTGISPVNVNSTRNDLMKAYPQLKSTLQTLPANATLKSVVPTIYTKIK